VKHIQYSVKKITNLTEGSMEVPILLT